MKRNEILNKLSYVVSPTKQVRMIIHTDAKNEADDQFAIMHHLLTPYVDVRGIIAAHFEAKYDDSSPEKGTSMEQSYKEIVKILSLAKIDDIPVYKGAVCPLQNYSALPQSEGSEFIIREALRDDSRPLFIALMGGVTDLAIACLTCPEIEERIHAIWIGGGSYPAGGWEFNLLQDIKAANHLFSSKVNLWQIPRNAYSQMTVTLSELAYQIKPCAEIGNYLVEQLFSLNDAMGQGSRNDWPHGEVWCLGDSPSLGVLLMADNDLYYHETTAPLVNDDLTYRNNPNGKKIRVYDIIDSRLIWSDFVAKMNLIYNTNH